MIALTTDAVLRFLRQWRHYNGFDSKTPNANVVRMHPFTCDELIMSQRRCEPGWDLIHWHKDDSGTFIYYLGMDRVQEVKVVLDGAVGPGEFIFGFD